MGIDPLSLGIITLIGGAAYGGMELAKSQAKERAAERPAESRFGIPLPPSAIAEATSAEKVRIRKKTQTILTSPLTGGEEFGSSAPTLLGTGDVTKKQTLG